jgi:hypothetical protein
MMSELTKLEVTRSEEDETAKQRKITVGKFSCAIPDEWDESMIAECLIDFANAIIMLEG